MRFPDLFSSKKLVSKSCVILLKIVIRIKNILTLFFLNIVI